jgi:hypothetical protein
LTSIPATTTSLLTLLSTWIGTGAIFTAPLWLVVRSEFLALGWLGPLGLLAFKPGENLLGKLILLLAAASPPALVLALLRRRWARLSVTDRILYTTAASTLWHAPSSLLWISIVSGMN